MLWWNIVFPQQWFKVGEQVFFKEFLHRCRTAILKNTSWWLLLRTNFFWKHSCLAASQRQLQTHIHFKAGLYDEIFLSRPWNFYFEGKVLKQFKKRNVCREILFSLLTQSSFIHTIMITFHLLRELTFFIFLVIDITVLNHVWKYWKAPTIMLFAIEVKLDGEVEQVKKREKRSACIFFNIAV